MQQGPCRSAIINCKGLWRENQREFGEKQVRNTLRTGLLNLVQHEKLYVALTMIKNKH